MNDIETLVYNEVKSALTPTYPTLKIDTVEDYSPEQMPCVQVMAVDYSKDYADSDSSGTEKLTVTVIELSIWAEGSKRKHTAKDIFTKANSKMELLGFTRIDYAPLVMDKTIFRIVARYDAKVGKKGNDLVIYRR